MRSYTGQINEEVQMLVLQWSVLPWIFWAHYQPLIMETNTSLLCQTISPDGSYPIANQEAQTIADVLTKEFICRFGVPLLIHTDQGRNFESKLMAEVCELLDIKKTRTTAYHPQSDGMVERFNQTLEAQLSKFADHNQRDWDQHIPFLLMAYRSAMHDTTGNTPAKMMLGR